MNRTLRSHVSGLLLAAIGLGLAACITIATAADPPIDFERARQLIQKERSGQTLTVYEQDYLQRDTQALLQNARVRFPNLRIAYLGSRIYGGYAGGPLNPEPYAYESAFVVRWLIQDQIAGAAALTFDPEKGQRKWPLLLWGPYLWADGVQGRKTDDLVWISKPTPWPSHGSTSPTNQRFPDSRAQKKRTGRLSKEPRSMFDARLDNDNAGRYGWWV
jgi:hypothetical protein